MMRPEWDRIVEDILGPRMGPAARKARAMGWDVWPGAEIENEPIDIFRDGSPYQKSAIMRLFDDIFGVEPNEP